MPAANAGARAGSPARRRAPPRSRDASWLGSRASPAWPAASATSLRLGRRGIRRGGGGAGRRARRAADLRLRAVLTSLRDYRPAEIAVRLDDGRRVGRPPRRAWWCATAPGSGAACASRRAPPRRRRSSIGGPAGRARPREPGALAPHRVLGRPPPPIPRITRRRAARAVRVRCDRAAARSRSTASSGPTPRSTSRSAPARSASSSSRPATRGRACAAVHEEDLAGDVVGAGGEEADRLRHVLGPPVAAHGDAARRAGAPDSRGKPSGSSTTPGATALTWMRGREGDGEAPREHDHARLGDAVGDVAGQARTRADVRDVDDAPAAAAHERGRPPGAEERRRAGSPRGAGRTGRRWWCAAACARRRAALLTRMSSRPRRRTASVHERARAARPRRRRRAARPRARRRARELAHGGARRRRRARGSRSPRPRPRRARASAISRPTRTAPPVTSATLPVSSLTCPAPCGVIGSTCRAVAATG